MRQQEKPEEFVIATREQYSVRQFVELAAAELGIKLTLRGIGTDEIGPVSDIRNDQIRCKLGDVVVRVDTHYFRPAEVETMLEDSDKAPTALGGVRTITFQQFGAEMAASGREAARRDSLVKEAGFPAYECRD